MSRPLNEQELHNLAMNIVGKDLEKKGYEFIAVNSQLKKHPQFVCVNKKNERYFVIVKASQITEAPITYDVIWMETFKNHAREQQAKVLFAGVGLGHPNNKLKPPFLNQEYLLQYDGLNHLEIELN
jgi:predicted transcriptional regulator YdeE